MLLQKIAGGEHHAVGVVARFLGEQHASLNACLLREERLGGGESLLNVVGIGHEVGDAHRGGDFSDVGELVALDQILKPGGTRFQYLVKRYQDRKSTRLNSSHPSIS